MFRIFIGSILGGLLQFAIGAIAWVSPLGNLAFTNLGEGPTADLQAAMARTLTPTGTGTYFLPSPDTANGAVLMGRGPVSLVFFNTSGFPAMDSGAIVTGLLMSIAMLLIVGVALSLVEGFGARLRVALLFGAAAVGYFVLSLPVYNFYLPWGWWIFLAVQEYVAFAAGVIVMIRWFVPARALDPTTGL